MKASSYSEVVSRVEGSHFLNSRFESYLVRNVDCALSELNEVHSVSIVFSLLYNLMIRRHELDTKLLRNASDEPLGLAKRLQDSEYLDDLILP